MKIIQHINNVVVDILNVRDDATTENIKLIESIPTFEPREGFNGILMYGENGLYWKYEETPVVDEISDSQALDIIIGGVGE